MTHLQFLTIRCISGFIIAAALSYWSIYAGMAYLIGWILIDEIGTAYNNWLNKQLQEGHKYDN